MLLSLVIGANYDIPKSKCGGRFRGGRNLQRYSYGRGEREVDHRLDTLEWNSVARAMYRKLGYAEVGIVDTELQGLSNVSMVLLEKYLG